MSGSDRVGDFKPTPGSTIDNAPSGLTRLYVDSENNDDLYRIDDAGNRTSVTSSAIFDGIDTQANILAMSATTFLGQLWWANDTKVSYKAITDLSTTDVWQPIQLLYDETTDSFCLTSTQDGQNQNLGQENFMLAFNIDSTGATELDPKVFFSVGAKVGEEKFQDFIKVLAGDLAEGAVFGINTTVFGVSERGKLTTYGLINGVNTSVWGVNDILYVDPTTAGDLTNVQPEISAFNVGKVLKSDPTTGILFVNTVTTNRVDNAVIPIGIDFIFFTGETIMPAATTFYKALVEDLGSVVEATEIVVVPDNSIVAAGQDIVTDPVTAVNTTINAGLRNGQIEFEISSAGGQEKIFFEIYDSDGDGTVIDSGILTEPIGDLGVRPILTLSTSLLDVDATDPFKESLTGLLTEDYIVVVGNRLRVHILCEKIGTAGGSKTFTLFFGSDHRSFLEAIARIGISDVEGLQDALDLRAKWVLPWVQATYDNRTQIRIGEYTTISNKETDDYPVPIPVGEPAFLMDAVSFINSANVSVIYSGHSYSFTEFGWLTQLRIWAPILSGTTNYRIIIIDNTDPSNPTIETIPEPILNEDDWTIVSVGTIIVGPGTELIIFIDALDTGSDSTLPSRQWTFAGVNNTGSPLSGDWNRNNQHTIIRFNDLDDGGVDRDSELTQITVGSTIRVTDNADVDAFWEYEVTSVTDNVTFFTFGVFLSLESGGGVPILALTDYLTTIPVPSSTQYANDAGFWTGNDPDFANVTGFLEFDGVTQGGNDDTGFGVDIRFQKAQQSPDWDIVSISGVTGGSGGETTPVTTKGDLYTYSTSVDRLAVGADTFVLTADSAETTGLKWAAGGGGGTSFQFYYINAVDMEEPDNFGWANNGVAPQEIDFGENQFNVAAMDSSSEEGRGIKILIPATAANMTIEVKTRRDSGTGAANWIFRVYTNEIPNMTSSPLWSSGIDTTLAVQTNSNYRDDAITKTLAAWGVTADKPYLLELTRNSPSGSDTLTGVDILWLTLLITFT